MYTEKMIHRINTVSLSGLEGDLIEVEVDIASGLSKFEIVGLAGKAVQEAKNRVASALRNSGFYYPTKRITVNLAPADLIKTGPAYDLPIAVGILAATNQIKIGEYQGFWGELSLQGNTRRTNGALAVVDSAQKLGLRTIFIPIFNATEAGIIAGIDIRPVKSLEEIADHFAGKEIKTYQIPAEEMKAGRVCEFDFKQVKGQYQAKRAFEIAAAGGHNVLLSGSPGAGKTFLSKCFAGILPKMELEESLEVTKIHSVAGVLPQDCPLVTERPFRNPHHTSSQAALIGGGSKPRPGEVSLSHRGVLFLDEFNEFTNKSLEALRQPLEDRVVHVARAAGVTTFPANFILVATMNPCKCGYYGDETRECTCTAHEIAKYSKKVSGPILDRIDLQIHVKRVKQADFFSSQHSEESSKIRSRVEHARRLQLTRYQSLTNERILCNGEVKQKYINDLFKLEAEAERLMKSALEKLRLSARGFYRVLKVSRTIADLTGEEQLKHAHVAEALSYRLAC